jgi:hypothetical protein
MDMGENASAAQQEAYAQLLGGLRVAQRALYCQQAGQ